MITLIVDTSQDRAQLILSKNESVLGEVHWEKAKSHSEKITTAFQKLLQISALSIHSIQRVGCVVGPGSFTGLRVGVNFSRSIAYTLQCPCLSINALDLLALNARNLGMPIVSVIDAQKNSVFLSLYDAELTPIQKNLVVPIQKLAELIRGPQQVCGPGFYGYQPFIEPAVRKNLHMTAENIHADLKNLLTQNPFLPTVWQDTWKQLIPVYIKSSAPEEKLKPTTF